jgi:hypothetical protein
MITELEILPASFELIRDRIAEILYNELLVAYEYTDLDWMDVRRVYIDRYIPFNESELPAVNVGVARVDLDGHTVVQSDGTTTYMIDVIAGAKTSQTRDGGAIAQAQMQRLVGLCRAIIEHTEYKTLGFTPPFIMFRRITQLMFNPSETKDLFSVARGRIMLMVKAPESNGLYVPSPIGSYKTVVTLHDSDKGYLYFGPPEAAEGEGLDLTVDQPLI